MENVIDITSRINQRKEREQDVIVHEDPFIVVRSSQAIEYTELGIETWAEAFEYAGVDITQIKNLKEHADALENIRFSELPPYTK